MWRAAIIALAADQVAGFMLPIRRATVATVGPGVLPATQGVSSAHARGRV